MATLPCPRCGKKEVIGTFCESCLRELHPLIARVKDTKVVFCSMSADVRLGASWERASPDEAILRAATKALVAANDAVIESIVLAAEFTVPEFLGKPGLKRTVEVPLIVHGKAAAELPHSYDEQYMIPVTVETTISPRYAKTGTQYFEAIIQVRNENSQQKKALLAALKHHKGCAINKENPIKGPKPGTDYYVTDKKAAFIVAQAMHARFGGIMKRNTTLFTRDRQTSKEVYRDTFLLEYPSFAAGDVVTDGKNVFRVVQLGKRIKFEDLTTKKRIMEVYEAGKYSTLPVVKTTVSQERPRIAVIDPETYQQVPVQNRQPPKIAPGSDVRVVKLGKKLWLVP